MPLLFRLLVLHDLQKKIENMCFALYGGDLEFLVAGERIRLFGGEQVKTVGVDGVSGEEGGGKHEIRVDAVQEVAR
ncbi:hypothetical protein U1Q18_001404 [Sarracenia purpurea var. burkii]